MTAKKAERPKLPTSDEVFDPSYVHPPAPVVADPYAPDASGAPVLPAPSEEK